MPTPQASEAFYRTLQRLELALVLAGRRAWSRMRDDFDASWAEVSDPLLAVVSAAQFAAASAATAYVPAVLDETGQPDVPEARVDPRAFAGVASDGRALDTLMQGAVVAAKRAVQGTITREGNVTRHLPGVGSDEALDIGGRWLDRALGNQIQDAARQATGVEIATRRQMGYVRMVNPPCCGRCAILAGKWFRYNAGFPRHDNCDCKHIPAVEDRAEEFRTDPDMLLRFGYVKGLTRAQRQALDDGADFSRVVNVGRSGMYTTVIGGVKVRGTTEATTTRGIGSELGNLQKLAGERYRRSRTLRLTPETIYQVARDRDDALRLLKSNGYIYDFSLAEQQNIAAKAGREAYAASRAARGLPPE